MHHSFDVDHAAEYGIEEAILIHHFRHWIAINKRMGKNFIDGRTWSYQTQEYLLANFFYHKNRHKVSRLLKSLIDQGVLLKGNYNKSGYDRTTWFAFADEEKFLHGVKEDPDLFEPVSETLLKNEQCIAQDCAMDCAKVSNGLRGSEPPIPDTLTDDNKKKLSVADAAVAAPLKKITLLRYKGHQTLEITSTDLFSKIFADGKNWQIDEITQAWQALADCKTIIYDWWRFIAGTIENIKRKTKSKNINGDKKCKTDAQKTDAQKTDENTTCKTESLKPLAPGTVNPLFQNLLIQQKHQRQ